MDGLFVVRTFNCIGCGRLRVTAHDEMKAKREEGRAEGTAPLHSADTAPSPCASGPVRGVGKGGAADARPGELAACRPSGA